MGKIAVDIVLLPGQEVMDKAIDANKELLKQYPDKIVLNKKDCLPHISLAMACIEKSRIGDIGKILYEIAENYSLELLNFTGLSTETNSLQEEVTVAKMEKSITLQLLHEEIMNRFKGFYSYDVTADNLLSDTEIAESTLHWIKNFPEKSGFERYSPHITLGYGRLECYSFPKKIGISSLALCHLGNHCTCRKVLLSAAMKK